MSHRTSIVVSASTEFIALCQSQMSLLTQTLGATWSAVYLTEGLVEGKEARLIPLVVYPQTARAWQKETDFAVFPELWDQVDSTPRLISAAASESVNSSEDQEQTNPATEWEGEYLQRQQIVLPLIYEDIVMGLLVTGRDDRQWNDQEFTHVEGIAKTLAIACILDQRQGWYHQQLNEQQNLRQIERNRFDDLLHQIRNPITALRTFSKLLLKRLLPGDRNQSVAQGILQEGDRLQALLQQFEGDIDLIEANASKLMLGSAPMFLPEAASISSSPLIMPGNSLSLESVKIEKVLETLLISAQAIAQEREIDFNVDIPSNLSPVQANNQALREVLSNLIDNALKYTPSGGTVNIQGGLEKQILTKDFQGIAICDNGYGIPVEDRQHLFERHYRGVQEKGDIDGSGLGLAIAKELVEQMHGEIELVSQDKSIQSTLGQSCDLSGTTFIVWLLRNETTLSQ